MILKTWGEKKKEERRKKTDTVKAPHITEASSAPPKTSVFWEGFFLKRTGGHGPGPVVF